MNFNSRSGLDSSQQAVKGLTAAGIPSVFQVCHSTLGIISSYQAPVPLLRVLTRAANLSIASPIVVGGVPFQSPAVDGV